MKTRITLILMAMIMAFGWSARADETITVSATNEDISQNLDLRAVATLFGQCANLEEFEQKLNSEDAHVSNLDLNGDGDVDYLRIVESADGNKHLILIQAVLAKDIFQDVASIYVEKDKDNQVVVQVIGDEYIYGTAYIIEPAYLYTPVIYDWFWGPHWVCWYSPWYWGYWPGWWHAYHCWAFDVYWNHIWDYHYHHHYCSFSNTRHPAPGYNEMHRHSQAGRQDYAVRHPEGSFSSRNAGKKNGRGDAVHSARDIQRGRADAGQSRTSQVSDKGRADNSRRTYDSSNTRVARDNNSAAPSRSDASSARRESAGSSTSRTSANNDNSSSRSSASTSRRSGSTSSASSSSSASTSRSSSSSASRSSSTTTTSRSSSSSSSRSSASTSRSSSSSAPSRSSGSFGGSSSGRSSGGFSGGASRSGGSMGGGSHGGGSRGGGGGGGRRR